MWFCIPMEQHVMHVLMVCTSIGPSSGDQTECECVHHVTKGGVCLG